VAMRCKRRGSCRAEPRRALLGRLPESLDILERHKTRREQRVREGPRTWLVKYLMLPEAACHQRTSTTYK